MVTFYMSVIHLPPSYNMCLHLTYRQLGHGYEMLGMCAARSAGYTLQTTTWSVERSIHCPLSIMQSNYHHDPTLNPLNPPIL